MHLNRKNLVTQLCRAVNDGEPRTVQALLLQGANPNLIGKKGVAAVHLAVGKETEKSSRCLKLLLQHGADTNVRSSEGLTPLHVAALWGCYQNLKLLLKNGGNPNLKDQDGNKPGDLAQQQDNRKCALLLQEYQSHSFDTEDEDLPQFQYSVYSGQADTSSYTESEDCSVSSSSLSLLSDFGEGPLSSTRCSSFLELSAINSRPSWRGGPYSGPSDAYPKACHTQEWDIDSELGPKAPSMLSSTRVSVAASTAALPILQEGVPLTDSSVFSPQDVDYPMTGNRFSPQPLDILPPCPSWRTSRKSVSFKDEDEYFPVFSSESPRQAQSGGHCSKDCTLDFSEYSDFLDSERMATVLHHQGIDVTSPDHVIVFSRSNDDDCTVVDMDKTRLFPFEENKMGDESVDEVKVPEQPPCSSGSSSSGTSNYSSCESDHYTSALDASWHPRRFSRPEDEKRRLESIEPQNRTDSNCVFRISNEFRQSAIGLPIAAETQKVSKLSEMGTVEEELPVLVDNLTISEETPPTKVNLSEVHRDLETFPYTVAGGRPSVEEGVSRQTGCTPIAGAAAALEEDFDLPHSPSPFVTGRTRSRLSRCSLRTSKTPESLLSTSFLFEQTLPTPTRTCHRNTKSPGSNNVFYNTPDGRCASPVFSGNWTGSCTSQNYVIQESEETQSSTPGGGSCVCASQADTLIITPSMADTVIRSQSLADTVILERHEETSTDSENQHVEPTYWRRIEGCNFLTDDLSSSSEAVTKRGETSVAQVELGGSLGPREEGSWTSEDVDSQPESTSSLSSSQTPSSSSSSSYFSPKRSGEPPSTPGTGCTPRYSMSRLSGFHKPQRLANLSYTPGGRPLIQDLEEPVEYLYTDTEQGHELIETHVPPTANTSLSSSMSTSTSEDTVLYDWQSLQGQVGLSRGKENQKPQKEETWSETKGLTDKELRHRLLEMGESPGPISNRTRPVYMKKLHRLMQKPTTQPPLQQQSDQPHPGFGHSPELGTALCTFVLPDCQADELALCQQFDQPDQNKKWREGVIKSSFNYLLLDPRVTKNLPYRSQSMTPLECFQTFISAIFYVGKGKRSRPYSHLYEALEYYKGDKTSKKLCSKVQHILQVWKAEQGVISLHCFQNVIPVEAYTREASMVDAIGVKMLTNQKRGDYYGVASTWQMKRKRELGVHLLYRAMQIFLAEGERQLRPADIRAGN